ncbi:MAG: hypothetical protein HQM08_14740 [Candidatus Riflebacteria bacterium]|nr:hypothetical protein [Candidatus Riflebacteria bacterium]
MSVSLEFLTVQNRRLAIGRKFPIAFLISFVFIVVLALYLKKTLEPQHKILEIEKQALSKEEQTLSERAKKALIGAEKVTEIKAQILQHNLELMGKRSKFAYLFTQLEKILPENAVIVQLETLSNKPAPITNPPKAPPPPILKNEDREFKMLVLFEDLSTLPILHRRFTGGKDFSNVLINPKGKSSYLGRIGESIEITFKMEES